ncbi:methionyl-tRNA formyltransferase [Hyphobacterium marinum]|uniref:Formyltransferase family protein n=1 Tax=Hyphobacterium marinum TaxID=3116574 RepID=A0ABU7LY42_9PROT|nr:formyltransferase family protein [Hyphobacterium sp. Y6023]MEE2566463.1 formyltransferase family protein [Hyphobacterium sp. Y6023]
MHAKVLILGNRLLGGLCLDFLARQDGVEILVVLNPDDDGSDGPGGISLKRRAAALGVRTIQPSGIRDAENQRILRDFEPDLGLSFSYARIIPQEVIDLPKSGFLNVHFADLPKNRGCLPVIWTIATGADHYAATLHEVTIDLDQGAILSQARAPLTEGLTAGEVYAACAHLGFGLFRDFWAEWSKTRTFASVPQDESAVTYHKMRFPHDRWIQWDQPAHRVARLINALTYFPHPCARTALMDGEDEIGLTGPAISLSREEGGQPGDVISTECGPAVRCGEGAVLVHQIRMGDTLTGFAEFLDSRPARPRFHSPETPEYSE